MKRGTWDWSRRLSLSYYSKGPGIAWLIRSSTALFGASEWSVRLPPRSRSASRLRRWRGSQPSGPRLSGVHARHSWLSRSLHFSRYQTPALLMTIDAPYIACWALATCAAWTAYSWRARREAVNRRVDCLRRGDWCRLPVQVFDACCFPGLALFAWSVRVVARPGVAGRAAAACLALAVCVSPVVLVEPAARRRRTPSPAGISPDAGRRSRRAQRLHVPAAMDRVARPGSDRSRGACPRPDVSRHRSWMARSVRCRRDSPCTRRRRCSWPFCS